MIDLESQSISRLSDLSIVSVIFAPKCENYSPLSLRAPGASEATALEWLVAVDELVERRLVQNLRRAIKESLAVVYECVLADEASPQVFAALASLNSCDARQAEAVPARKFPFASHIDLVTSPTEGLLFDADDFTEK